MKFKIKTLGCKVNNYESEMIKESMLESGYDLVNDNPDIYIINTCSVTNNADSKSMQMIRQARKELKEGIVIVVGCVIESMKEDLSSIPADIIIGNYDKSNIVSYIKKYLENKKQIISLFDLNDKDFENMLVTNYDSKTRAFVKIQDGCNNFCSYCIIPYLRGRTRSKSFDVVIKEIEKLSLHHSEIVLTGIHTGSYLSNDKDLTDLIIEISKIENIKRIRLSSIEITELNDKFLNELKSNSKICDHLHIPIQSGANSVLKNMNRKYDKEYFIDKVKIIRSIRPNINLTTDLIIGFPNESDADFKETINTLNIIKFSKIHVFPYSLRKGTVASKMSGQVESKIKKQRVKEIIDLSNNYEESYSRKFINEELDVLIETVKDKSIGHSSNYIEIEILEKLIPHQLYKVKIIGIKDSKLIGKLI